MSCFGAARSAARSSAGRFGSAARSFASASKSKPSCSPFSAPSSSTPTVFRSAAGLSRCVESLLPFHTATASSLLLSSLSIPSPISSWNIEGM